MRFLYIIYQICIGLPIFLVLTILTALTTMLGCWLGNGHFWGYYPGKIWSQLTCFLFLLPVKVEGHQHIDHKTSYVFVANHQGAFDIFLIYGFLGRNFKWMMKKSLRNIPFVGKACGRIHLRRQIQSAKSIRNHQTGRKDTAGRYFARGIPGRKTNFHGAHE